MQTHQLRPAAPAAALLVLVACSLPSLPASPSGPSDLQIRGTTLLMVGARGQLTAWKPGDGEAREVPATWTVEGDAVSVSSRGVVVARGLGHAIVRARYQDLTGSATVHVVGSIAGTWRGSLTVAACWQSVPTSPDPCEDRRGLTAPLVLTVTQSATADQFDNLRAIVDVFAPPASGSFIGAVESSGLVFLEGAVQRSGDGLSGAVNFRWQLENDRLVPSTMNPRGEDIIEVQLGIRAGSWVSLSEFWRVSTMTR